tara:strand:- start:3962 stop:4282 length:321 start_codon:yes stop_codon:yes gene_type:complete
MKIGTKKELITKLLTEQPYIRDMDNSLLAEIWKKEIAKLENYENFSATDLLCIISSGKLTSAESITRCRRKIQQENPSLRGQKYKARHKEQIEVKQELKDWNNEKK